MNRLLHPGTALRTIPIPVPLDIDFANLTILQGDGFDLGFQALLSRSTSTFDG
jgi:hypothetical protein